MTLLSRSASHQPDYYQLLAINPSATLKDIEKAYRRQALIHHPDRNPNTAQNQSTGNFQNIAEAFEVLRDRLTIKRIKYDLKRSKSALDREASKNSTSNLRTAQPQPSPSNREAKGSDRSSTLDLFGYPGEIPQYVPALHRRSASTTPFSFRQAPPQPTEKMHANEQNVQKNSDNIHRPFSVSPPSHYPESHQPFTQKIKLKDLDSLKLNINFTSRPQVHPVQSSDPRTVQSSDPRRSQTRSNSLNPQLSGKAPDPYLTFQRAWGKNLDDIIDGIIDREIEQKKQFNSRKSHTGPMLSTDPRPRVVHRSSTVRSADSDYRPTSYDHSQRRPRSASGDRIRDTHQFPINRIGPQSVPAPIPREMGSPIEDMKPYLPSSSHHIRGRRMSTGPDNMFNPCPMHDAHRLYRPMSNSSSGSSIPYMQDRGGGSGSRHSTSTASPIIQPSSSPQEVPFFPNSSLGSGRSRASTGGLGKEFREVIIRFERETDGSTRLSKEMKSRTIDVDGTVHDRYRRQRSAAVK